MAAFQVVNTGVRGRAGPGFVIDRPNGSGDFLFILFHAPIRIQLTLTKPAVTAGAGACMLLTPTNYHRYEGWDAAGKPGVLDNSWVHFHSSRMRQCAKNYALIFNTLIYPLGTDELRGLVAAVRRETLRRDRYWEERASLLLHDLLLCFARNTAAAAAGAGRRALRQQKLEQDLRQTREEIHNRLQERWTLAAMARRMNLSASRFAGVYAAQFGIPPLQDLIEARISKACEYLTNTAIQVKEVAALCGFDSTPYFTRAFRARMGIAPNQYRNFRPAKALP